MVDSFGFNDRNLVRLARPAHTEALRTTERYTRRNDGQLLLDEKVRLIPCSENSFSGADGLWFEFDPKGEPAAFMIERHVSGDYPYARQLQK